MNKTYVRIDSRTLRVSQNGNGMELEITLYVDGAKQSYYCTSESVANSYGTGRSIELTRNGIKAVGDVAIPVSELTDDQFKLLRDTFIGIFGYVRRLKGKPSADNKFKTPYFDAVVSYDTYMKDVYLKIGSMIINLKKYDDSDEYSYLYKTFNNIAGDWRDMKNSNMMNDEKLMSRINKQAGFAKMNSDRDRDNKVYGFNGSFDALKRHRINEGQWQKRYK